MHYGLIGLLSKLSSVCLHIKWYLVSLPVELEHHALWAIKQLNFNLSKANELSKPQILELEEIQNEAYENTKITKSRTKFFHDQCIHRKNFVSG